MKKYGQTYTATTVPLLFWLLSMHSCPETARLPPFSIPFATTVPEEVVTISLLLGTDWFPNTVSSSCMKWKKKMPCLKHKSCFFAITTTIGWDWKLEGSYFVCLFFRMIWSESFNDHRVLQLDCMLLISCDLSLELLLHTKNFLETQQARSY